MVDELSGHLPNEMEIAFKLNFSLIVPLLARANLIRAAGYLEFYIPSRISSLRDKKEPLYMLTYAQS